MWTIRELRSVAKELASAPLQIRKKYEFWKNVVRNDPSELRQLKGFGDEALAGEWRGFCSSRLNDAYRVVYRVSSEHITVTVERVSKHDYRK